MPPPISTACSARPTGQGRQQAKAPAQKVASAQPRRGRAAVTPGDAAAGHGWRRFEVALSQDAPQPFGLERRTAGRVARRQHAARRWPKVASGGELSRLALAIAVTTSQLGEAGTLIFDEVDAGVGGRPAAETVGRLMKQLARPPGAGGDAPAAGGGLRRPSLRWSPSGRRGGRRAQRRHAGGRRGARGRIARMLGGEAALRHHLAHAQEMLVAGRRVAGAQGAQGTTGSGQHPRGAGMERRSPVGTSAAARGGAGHRHLRLGQVGGAACAGRRRLLLRRQPAARAAARVHPPSNTSASIGASPSRWTMRSAGSLPHLLPLLGRTEGRRRGDHRAVPRRLHRRAGAPLLRDAAPASAVRRTLAAAACRNRRREDLRHEGGARWSTRSSSSANCCPTCARSRP